jgi:uncharacterized membrane protein
MAAMPTLSAPPMTRTLAAYAATTLVMLALDLAWLGLAAVPLYQAGIGHLMAPQPNLVAAALFYAVYPLGLMVFAVQPGAGWRGAARRAALFGFFAYATYDLTNLATLKGWPTGLALIDIAWGCGVSTVAAAAGGWVLGPAGGRGAVPR